MAEGQIHLELAWRRKDIMPHLWSIAFSLACLTRLIIGLYYFVFATGQAERDAFNWLLDAKRHLELIGTSCELDQPVMRFTIDG